MSLTGARKEVIRTIQGVGTLNTYTQEYLKSAYLYGSPIVRVEEDWEHLAYKLYNEKGDMLMIDARVVKEENGVPKILDAMNHKDTVEAPPKYRKMELPYHSTVPNVFSSDNCDTVS